MDQIAQPIVRIVTNKWFVIICILIVSIAILNSLSEEHFRRLDPLKNTINIPTGIYSLSNAFGPIPTDSFSSTPIITNNLLTQSASSSPFSNQWAFKRVTDGVYLIRKPRANLQGAECLYSSTDYTVRGYIVTDPSICGMETLNDQNQLDPDSIRLYFKISKSIEDSNAVIIQSLQNNMYLSFDGRQLTLQPRLDKRGYFYIRK
jgi:hypothetical protein